MSGRRRATSRRARLAHAHPVRRGLATLGALAGLIFLVFNGGLPFRGKEGRPVSVVVAQANNLHSGDPVRVAGVEVGYVDAVDLAADARHAELTLRITDDALELRADASARARLRSLTGGPRYVELDPGTASAPLAESVIPLARTNAAVEFDDLLSIYRERAREGARASFAALDRGFGGDAAGRALERIGPAWRRGAPALRSLLGSAPGDLRGAVAGSARVLAALVRDERALARFPNRAGVVFGVTAARSGEIDAALVSAPGVLAETRTTMARLRPTLARLESVAESLRPGARVLAPAATALEPMLARLGDVLSTAEPVLADLHPALRALRPTSASGARLLPALEPTVFRLRDELIPFLARRDPDTGLRNYEAIGPGLSAAGHATSEFDANGYMLRFQTAPSERTIASLPCQLLITDPSAEEKIRCDALESVLGDLFGGFRLEREAGP